MSQVRLTRMILGYFRRQLAWCSKSIFQHPIKETGTILIYHCLCISYWPQKRLYFFKIYTRRTTQHSTNLQKSNCNLRVVTSSNASELTSYTIFNTFLPNTISFGLILFHFCINTNLDHENTQFQQKRRAVEGRTVEGNCVLQ